MLPAHATKRLTIPSLLALLLATGCGGGGSETFENPLNTAGLSDAEISAVATQLQTVSADATSGATASPTAFAAPRSLTRTVPLGGQQPCPLGGRISRSGNVTTTANQDGSWSVYGLVTFAISDPTNNLNDCEVAEDVILDGSLTLTVAGSSARGGVGASINGTIGINQRGPAGGLVPRGECYVFLTVPVGGNRATGSVCGRSVN